MVSHMYAGLRFLIPNHCTTLLFFVEVSYDKDGYDDGPPPPVTIVNLNIS